MKIWNNYILLLIILGMCSPILSAISDDFETLHEANLLLSKRNLSECIIIMEDLIKKNPNPAFYLTLVKAYIGQENYLEAIDTIEKGQKKMKEHILPNGKTLYDFDDTLCKYEIEALNRADSLDYITSLKYVKEIVETKPMSYLGKSILSLYQIRNSDYEDALNYINVEIVSDSLDILMIAIRGYANLRQNKIINFFNDFMYIRDNLAEGKIYDEFEYYRTLKHIETELRISQKNDFLSATFYYLIGENKKAFQFLNNGLDKYLLKSKEELKTFINNSLPNIPLNEVMDIYDITRG